MSEEIPTYDCKSEFSARDGTYILTFKCPKCRKTHTHGSPDNTGGHRIAHCTDKSLHPSGYYLRTKAR